MKVEIKAIENVLIKYYMLNGASQFLAEVMTKRGIKLIKAEDRKLAKEAKK